MRLSSMACSGQSLIAHTCVPQTLAQLHHPHTGDLLDRALVLRFPGPASFTGAVTRSHDIPLFCLPSVQAAVFDPLVMLLCTAPR